MGKRTEDYVNYPAWTRARFWSFIRSTLRRAWTRYPPKYKVLNNARKKVEGKRHKFEYKCAACGGWFKAREVQVDHLIDAGSLKDYTDLPGFVERLFTSEDMLQVLCKSCHSSKTQKARNEKRTS